MQLNAALLLFYLIASYYILHVWTHSVKDIKPKLTQISGPCPHHRCLDQTASSMRHRFHINMISPLALWSRQIVHKMLKWEIWSHLQLHLSSVLQTFISGENKNKKRKEILNKMTKREYKSHFQPKIRINCTEGNTFHLIREFLYHMEDTTKRTTDEEILIPRALLTASNPIRTRYQI